MMAAFAAYIKTITALAVFSALVGLLLPEGKYRRYTELVLGILVMTNAFNLVAIANLAGACFLISYLAVFVAHWRLRKETQGNALLIILGFLLMLFILGAFFYQMFFSQPYLIPLIVLFVAACFILEFLIRRKIAKNVPGVS